MGSAFSPLSMTKLVFHIIIYVGIENLICFVSLRMRSENYAPWADIHFANILATAIPIYLCDTCD